MNSRRDGFGRMPRKRFAEIFVVAACVALVPTVAAAADDVTAISFKLQPRDPQAAPYEIRLLASGEGTYSTGPAEQPNQAQVRVSPATLSRIQAGLGKVDGGKCETHEKHIAQTGMKTLTVERGGAPAACTFNYSDDAKLMDTVAAFEAMAETIQIGDRLAREHRFDRLGLDAEMELLTNELAEGRALEPGNIAPVLEAIAQDERVIDRVRRKAQRLLSQETEASVGSPR